MSLMRFHNVKMPCGAPELTSSAQSGVFIYLSIYDLSQWDLTINATQEVLKYALMSLLNIRMDGSMLSCYLHQILVPKCSELLQCYCLIRCFC